MSSYRDESTLAHPAPIGDRAIAGDNTNLTTRLRATWSAARARAAGLPRAVRWEGAALGAILALAAVLNFLYLDRQGYANSYYAATVRSMLASWHNFFYASFDPGGFVTVDKPPVGFWVQAASAKLFGFSGWSLLFPQALAGVGSVALLWWLVRRAWGSVAGLVAALALAVTPISVVTARNNTIDSLLVLCTLGAAWATGRAIESARHPLRWMLLAALLVGLGFNIKMLQAYLVLPALWLAYLLVARRHLLARVAHLAAATVVLLAVSLSWAVAVDLTPAAERPYVGSSRTNSVVELALGYNGLSRLFGNAFGRGGSGEANYSVGALLSNSGGAGGVGGVGENGPKGFFRLLNQQLGGQIGWLIPLAVAGLLAAAWWLRPRHFRSLRRFWCAAPGAAGAGPLRRRRASLIIWGLWFLPMAGFFSVAGFYHRYYLTMLAPGVAALTGLGVAVLWRAWRGRGRGRTIVTALLPIALVGTALVQRDILADYPTWSARLAPLILGLSIAAALALALARLLRGCWGLRPAWATGAARVALAAGVLTLTLTPAVWSGISVEAAGNGQVSNLPAAGPSGGGGSGGPGGAVRVPANAGDRPAGSFTPPAGMPANGTAAPGAQGRNAGGPGGMGQINAQLLDWLVANRGDATYLVAVTSSMQASPIIIQTGLPIMATGGFSGGDPILTADSLATLVREGTVRFFLGGGGGPGNAGGAGFSVNSWVTQNCATVPSSVWGGTASGQQLYDCGVVR